MPATHMTEEQEEAQKHGFMQPANPNMADQPGAKCCNATPDPFDMSKLEKGLTAEQRAEGQRLATEWQAAFGKKR